ncbi:hypothetical protein M0722_16235 [Microbacterium sp. KSW4-16]|uniref:hypothetical protein n=1 Tax=Microbacterium aurugineum TaxID=2851642 RepID=UPI0020C0C4E5|nr:hypothetical protein [Microbacterium aurugineum]MCK8468745.1 hypothetical protein [Microbacterium aurugineum]
MADLMRPLTLDAAASRLLESIEVSECDTEIAEALRREAAQLFARTRPSSPSLSADQRALLFKSGAVTPEQFAQTEQRVARGELREEEIRTWLGTIARSSGEGAVAARLNLKLDELRKRRRAGRLYAFDASGITVYPRWQFTDQSDDGLLPHLALVVAWLLEDWHPASVEGFMTTPKDSLIYRGEWQTPRQWLIQGASPHPIERLLNKKRW